MNTFPLFPREGFTDERGKVGELTDLFDEGSLAFFFLTRLLCSL